MLQKQKPTVVHLIDDTTAGGVMRVIQHVVTSPKLNETANHLMQRVARGKVSMHRIGAPVIVSHLSISWRTLPALLALRLRNPRAKIVHVEHSYTPAFVAHNVAQTRRFNRLLKIGFGLFDRVAAVSEGQFKWLLQDELVHKDKLSLVRSYADLAPFLALSSPTGAPKHFGAIGRLDRQKGFDLLIVAFRKNSDTALRLSIFGEGEEEARLRALAQGDPRIHFAGMAADPVASYRAVDAVIMPSRWEAYGLVAIETLCAGRALFCSDVDGLRDHQRIGAYLADIATLDFNELPDLTQVNTFAKRDEIAASLKSENIAAWEKLIAA